MRNQLEVRQGVSVQLWGYLSTMVVMPPCVTVFTKIFYEAFLEKTLIQRTYAYDLSDAKADKDPLRVQRFAEYFYGGWQNS